MKSTKALILLTITVLFTTFLYFLYTKIGKNENLSTVNKNEKVNINFLSKSCENGNMNDCFKLGYYYWTKENYKKALELVII